MHGTTNPKKTIDTMTLESHEFGMSDHLLSSLFNGVIHTLSDRRSVGLTLCLLIRKFLLYVSTSNHLYAGQ